MTTTRQIFSNAQPYLDRDPYFTSRIRNSVLLLLFVMICSGAVAQDNDIQLANGDVTELVKGQDKGAAFTIFEGTTSPIIFNGLNSFTVDKVNGEVLLTWVTMSDTRKEAFEVERSLNAIAWEKVGLVKANGDHSSSGEYKYSDQQPTEGVSYYRIRQIGEDGRVNYSHTLKVEMNKEDYPANFNLYPNPASGGTVYIKMPALVIGGTLLEIYDPTGRLYARQGVRTPMAAVDVNDFVTGVYLLKIQIGKTVWSQKLLIQ